MTGFFILVVMLNFTLSVIESIQYIAFSTSRTYYAADVDVSSQEGAALEKYNQLKEEGILKSLLREEWFEIQNPVFINSRDRVNGGVRLDVTARVLSFTLPFFLGNTGEPNTFKTNVNSYIGREPSMQECVEYNEDIKEEILNLSSSYRQGQIPSGMNTAPIMTTGDNGC